MRYYTTPNKLKDDGSHNARVLVNQAYSENELVDKILLKRNIVSKPDLRGVMSALKETIVEIVKEGNGLNLSWLKLGYSIKGSFATADTARDAEQHSLEINLNAGTLLTDRLAEIKMERVSSPNFVPKVISFTDGVSGTINSQATPGGIFKLIGEQLRIDGEQPETIGLFLQAEDGTETKVEVLMENNPAAIGGQLPDTLAAGNYKLVLKTQTGARGQKINEVRTGTSSFSLIVQ